jgi:hypothetical protein
MKFKVNFGKTRHRQTIQKQVPGFAATEEAATPPLATTAVQPRRVSRTARLLALAYHVERQIEAGAIKDYAEAAIRLGVTRARMTQVVNLQWLPIEVQERILAGLSQMSERRSRTRTSVLKGNRVGPTESWDLDRSHIL